MSEHLFDLGEIARIARETHHLDAYLRYTGFGTYSVWVSPVIDELPAAMAGPGNQDANAEGPILSRAVDLTVLTDEYDHSQRSAADLGLTTEADVAELLARVVREQPHPALSPTPTQPEPGHAAGQFHRSARTGCLDSYDRVAGPVSRWIRSTCVSTVPHRDLGLVTVAGP